MPDPSTAGPAAVSAPKRCQSATRKVTLLGLIAATYFMVAGGPYGLEDVVQEAGYFWGVVALLVVPLVWSLPTALMVSELSSALPEEGGFYIWVRRALGPFWGFQEAWLSLAASIFDMAIYPILFVTYLGFAGKHAARFLQALGLTAGDPVWWQRLADRKPGEPAWVIGLGIGTLVIVACVLSNLRGARTIGLSSIVLAAALLAPFGVLSVLAVVRPAAAAENEQRPEVQQSTEAAPENEDVTEETTNGGEGTFWIAALLFAMWNYMGWDNATTFAGEVERPQRTYPLAMAVLVVLVALTYVIPVAATGLSGAGPPKWDEGAWVDVGATIGGPTLAIAIGIGGMVMGYGMFNSLVLSYSRLPVVLARDGYLPAVFTRRLSNGAPWVAVLVLSVAWALAMQLGFKRALALDVILYGMSLLLEFVALFALRVREPELARPFRIPGGMIVACLLGLLPAFLIGLAIFDQAGKWRPEPGYRLAPAETLQLGAGLIVLGPVVYFAARVLAQMRGAQSET